MAVCVDLGRFIKIGFALFVGSGKILMKICMTVEEPICEQFHGVGASLSGCYSTHQIVITICT